MRGPRVPAPGERVRRSNPSASCDPPALDHVHRHAYGPSVALPRAMTKQVDSKIDQVADKATSGIEAITDAAKDVASRVSDEAKKLLLEAEHKATELKRAARDAALHTNDKLEDLKKRIN